MIFLLNSMYRQPSLYLLALDTRAKFVIMTIGQFHKTFALEVTISQKLCKNIVFNTLKKQVLDIC